MNRRAFLSLFGSGVAAAGLSSLLPSVDALVLQPDILRGAGISAQTPLVTFQQVLIELVRRIDARVSHPKTLMEGPFMVRPGFSQFGVDALIDAEGQWPTRELDVLADAFARRITQENMRWFSRLPSPSAVSYAQMVTSPKSGLSLRGIQDYDAERDRYTLRFDMCGQAA